MVGRPHCPPLALCAWAGRVSAKRKSAPGLFRRGCGDETWSAVINIYAGTLLAVSLLGAERLYSRQQHLQEDVLHPSKSWRVVSASLQDLREELVSSPITEAICFVCEKEPLQ